MADVWLRIRCWNNWFPSVARPGVITVNIHQAHIYLPREPQTHDPSPRPLRTPANKRSRQNRSVEHISGSCGRMSKPSELGEFQHQLVTKPTPNELVGGSTSAVLVPRHPAQRTRRRTSNRPWVARRTLASLSVLLLMKRSQKQLKAGQPAGVQFPQKPPVDAAAASATLRLQETKPHEDNASSAQPLQPPIFPGIFSSFQSCGLCLEWKIPSPVEALSHENAGLHVFLKLLYAAASKGSL